MREFQERVRKWCEDDVCGIEAEILRAGLWRDAVQVLESGDAAASAEISDALFFMVSEAKDRPSDVPAELTSRLNAVVKSFAESSDVELAGMARSLLCNSATDPYWTDAVDAIRSGSSAGWDAMTILALARRGDERSRAVIEEAIVAPAVHSDVRDKLMHGLYRAGRCARWREKFFTALSNSLGCAIGYHDPYLKSQGALPQPGYALSVPIDASRMITVRALDWESAVVVDLWSPEGSVRIGQFALTDKDGPDIAAVHATALIAG